MSIGPLGNATGVAGLPIAQTHGSEIDRTAGEAGLQRRRVDMEHRATAAAGVGEPDAEDFAASDRDADGRRPWTDRPLPDEKPPLDLPQNKDSAQQSGNLLDVKA